MSTTAIKTCKSRRVMGVLVSSIGTAIICAGCSANGFQSSAQKWETYYNPRYGFEFPYPSNWTSLAPPDNTDGVTLVSQKNQNTEIRAWAGKELPELQNPETIKQIDHNFETAQGISGVLIVEAGQQISSMKLTITHKQVKYHWQGQTSSKEFKDHYRLFYYIAKQYKIR
ncbi:hypothetical protein H6G06_21660 [Anabaena sphaerica FACHB-251]|uniref:PsbP C-terminal domain-containing protein n=1 Tax=Anabaena sphaerica FACHB-251 TaxID=2692883 RepID=A0A926WKY7_9NOST|nr:hypothetical protein [Anabaena sphaerica]MBD2296012.1 hypothetical protein [Anabaena sphaerica FACHB-251]